MSWQVGGCSKCLGVWMWHAMLTRVSSRPYMCRLVRACAVSSVRVPSRPCMCRLVSLLKEVAVLCCAVRHTCELVSFRVTRRLACHVSVVMSNYSSSSSSSSSSAVRYEFVK